MWEPLPCAGSLRCWMRRRTSTYSSRDRVKKDFPYVPAFFELVSPLGSWSICQRPPTRQDSNSPSSHEAASPADLARVFGAPADAVGESGIEGSSASAAHNNTGSIMEIRRLNTLRGMAALIVAISHFSNRSNLFDRLLGGGAGNLGVMLFFILSGFLMSYLYLDKPPTQQMLINYMGSRLARIVPLFSLVVMASFLTPYFYDIDTFASLISHLLFLHGNSILWTIPAEVQFYGLFLVSWVLCWKFPPSKLILPLMVFLSAFLLNHKTFHFNVSSLSVTISAMKTLPFFTVGCIFGALYGARLKLVQFQRHYYLLAILFILVLYPQIFLTLFGLRLKLWEETSILIAMGGVFFFIVFLVPDGNKFIENKIGDFYGKISYSLYLLHVPVMSFLKYMNLMDNNLYSLMAFLTLVTLVAAVSYTFIEKPLGGFIRSKIIK